MKDGQRNIYLFIGPPGSGKGTLSYLCVNSLGWVQLSTGNLCRKHITEQTEIGKQIDFAMKSGKLVSDSLITAMVEERLRETARQSHHIILDGYPRTVVQAEAFDTFLKTCDQAVKLHIIRFVIPDEVVISRIGGRLVCVNKECQKVYSLNEEAMLAPKKAMVCDVCGSLLGRRNDDAIAAIKERLVTYHKHEQQLLNFYKDRGYLIHEFNVEKPLDEVFTEFKALVGYSGI